MSRQRRSQAVNKPTMPPPASGVTVRMYKQIFGDCFLLAFRTTDPHQAYYMLIDCGVLDSTQEPERITEIAKNIAEATGGHIHLLVITHEHWDHVSGFERAFDVFKEMTIHNLWLAWTEDPGDDLAQELRTKFEKTVAALHLAVDHASKFAAAGQASSTRAVEHVTNLFAFFGGPVNLAAAGIEDRLSVARRSKTRKAIEQICAVAASRGAEPEYCCPGEGPLPLPTARNAPEVPDVAVYVLGPPHREADLRRINPTVRGKEVYTTASTALTLEVAFAMALQDQVVGDRQNLSIAERELQEQSFPFEERLRIS
ncbi:MAG: hypothetical protein CYG59_00760, partial [Chloroflexi bacterium]